MTLIIWIVLQFLIIIPFFLLIRRFSISSLPSIIYGLGVWIYLIAGMPFYDHSFGNDEWFARYFFALLLAIAPLWITLIISPKKTLSYESQKLELRSAKGGAIFFYLLWFIVLLIIFMSPKPILLSMLIDGNGNGESVSSHGLMEIRKEATYTVLFSNIKPFYYFFPSVLSLYGYLLFCRKELGIVANLLSILVALILSVQFLHKGPMVMLIAQLFLLHYLIKGRLSVVRIIMVIAITSLAILSAYFFYTGYINMQLVGNILNRVSVVYVEILQYGLSYEYSDFLWGVTFPNPMHLFPFEPVRLGGVVFDALYGGAGKIGNAPMPALGEGYVNFGWLGVIIIIGFISLWLIFLSFSYRFALKHPLYLSIWIYLAFSTNGFSRTSFFSILEPKILFLIVTLLIFLWIYNVLKAVPKWINTQKKHI
jgi:oligosaccharide repeat unit polymerase